MKTFLFIFLAGYAVRCDDSYYVVQMPEVAKSKEFKVYWNVPTMQCTSKKIPFENLFEKFGIIQNTNDVYRGDKIAILYDPGNFPALVKNESTGELKYRNGGVPQQGSLILHLQIFKHEVEKSIPNVDFNGIGIIDFESWRPVFRQNFGVLTPYKDVSIDIEKKRHWWWKQQWIQDEAKRRFEAAGRDFMEATLALAKRMRPKASWGYYGYPQCFNRASNRHPDKCPTQVLEENNVIDWLWFESTALFPSVYSTKDMSPHLGPYIRGRISESSRVSEKGVPILPYWWYRYRDGGFFSETDLDVAFSSFYKSNASGFIIWGSSKDVNAKSKCIELREYLFDILGPAVAKYTKPGVRFDDVSDTTTTTTTTTTESPDAMADLDPDYQWDPPENYTQNIDRIVNEELKNDNETKLSNSSFQSQLIGLILHKIANYCTERNCFDEASYISEPPTTVVTKNPFETTIQEKIKIGTTESNRLKYKPNITATLTTSKIITTTSTKGTTSTTKKPKTKTTTLSTPEISTTDTSTINDGTETEDTSQTAEITETTQFSPDDSSWSEFSSDDTSTAIYIQGMIKKADIFNENNLSAEDTNNYESIYTTTDDSMHLSSDDGSTSRGSTDYSAETNVSSEETGETLVSNAYDKTATESEEVDEATTHGTVWIDQVVVSVV